LARAPSPFWDWPFPVPVFGDVFVFVSVVFAMSIPIVGDHIPRDGLRSTTCVGSPKPRLSRFVASIPITVRTILFNRSTGFDQAVHLCACSFRASSERNILALVVVCTVGVI
jgi:hypothetical protein